MPGSSVISQLPKRSFSEHGTGAADTTPASNISIITSVTINPIPFEGFLVIPLPPLRQTTVIRRPNRKSALRVKGQIYVASLRIKINRLTGGERESVSRLPFKMPNELSTSSVTNV